MARVSPLSKLQVGTLILYKAEKFVGEFLALYQGPFGRDHYLLKPLFTPKASLIEYARDPAEGLIKVLGVYPFDILHLPLDPAQPEVTHDKK